MQPAVSRAALVGIASAVASFAAMVALRVSGLWHLDNTGAYAALWEAGYRLDYDQWHRPLEAATPYVVGLATAAGVVVGARLPPSRSALLRIMIFLGLVSASLLLATVYVRTMVVPFLLLAVVLHLVSFVRPVRTRLVASAWVIMFVLSVMPFDVSLHQYPGSPRFVPVVAGLFGLSIMDSADRGEIYAMLCPDFEPPRWMWVW